MKYLFSVENLNDKTRKIYYVEADNENIVVGSLNESFKRVITSLGSVEEINKL